MHEHTSTLLRAISTSTWLRNQYCRLRRRRHAHNETDLCILQTPAPVRSTALTATKIKRLSQMAAPEMVGVGLDTVCPNVLRASMAI